MTAWDELQPVIAGIREALTRYPGAGSEPPFHVGLAAWATDEAKQLHDRFGADVRLTVGALRYPSGELPYPRGAADDTPVADPAEYTFELAEPLTVHSGHNAHTELLIANHTDRLLSLHTNGRVTAVVVDPVTERVVGGSTGAQTLVLIIIGVAPDRTTSVPLTVGTASYDSTLGYAIPPGDWAIRIALRTADGPLRTPLLPLRVT
jgi:hypothetical protein